MIVNRISADSTPLRSLLARGTRLKKESLRINNNSGFDDRNRQRKKRIVRVKINTVFYSYICGRCGCQHIQGEDVAFIIYTTLAG